MISTAEKRVWLLGDRPGGPRVPRDGVGDVFRRWREIGMRQRRRVRYAIDELIDIGGEG